MKATTTPSHMAKYLLARSETRSETRSEKGTGMDYNYRNFNAKSYDLVKFRGPAPGQKAPDFEVTLADGTTQRLLAFDTRFLVLEMGSLTCPLFQGRRPKMARLDQRLRDVTFCVLYIREAHPGDQIGPHATLDDKRHCAARLSGEEGEHRKVLVDNLQGTAHAAYGGYPNSVFIINRNGCVVYASDWNDPKATGRALAQLLSGKPAHVRAYFKPVAPWVGLRVLRKGGRGSMMDFFGSFPRLIWNNLIRRNLRTMLRRGPKIASEIGPDTAC
jgi:hypothetical protein